MSDIGENTVPPGPAIAAKRSPIRAIASIFVLAGWFGSAVAQQEALLYIDPPSIRVAPGAQFDLAVRLNSAGALADAFQFQAVFDPGLFELVGVSSSPLFDVPLSETPNAAGLLVWAAGSSGPGCSGRDCLLATVRLRVRPGVTEGTGLFSIDCGASTVLGQGGSPILTRCANATIEVRAGAGAPTLLVGSASSECGEPIAIPITVSGVSNMSAFGMTLTYNPANLEFAGVFTASGVSDWSGVAGNEIAPGRVVLGGFRGAGTPVNDAAELVLVAFSCKSCPSANPITLSNFVDGLAGATFTPGAITCTGVEPTPTPAAPTPTPTPGPATPTPGAPNSNPAATDPTPRPEMPTATPKPDSPTPTPGAPTSTPDAPTPTPRSPAATPTPTPPPRGRLAVRLGMASGSCGETVTVPVTVFAASAMSAFGVTLSYDSTNLEFVSASAGSATAAWAAVRANAATAGRVVLVGFMGAGAPIEGTGEIARVTLRCRACPSRNALTLSGLLDDLRGAIAIPGGIVCEGDEGEEGGDAPLTIAVGSQEGFCDEVLTVPISVSGAAALGAFGMTLNYDAANLEFLSASTAEKTADWRAVTASAITTGRLVLSDLRGSGTPVSGEGELIRLSFRCKVCPSTNTLTLTGLVQGVARATAVSGSANCIENPEVQPTLDADAPSPAPATSPAFPINMLSSIRFELFAMALALIAVTLLFHRRRRGGS